MVALKASLLFALVCAPLSVVAGNLCPKRLVNIVFEMDHYRHMRESNIERHAKLHNGSHELIMGSIRLMVQYMRGCNDGDSVSHVLSDRSQIRKDWAELVAASQNMKRLLNLHLCLPQWYTSVSVYTRRLDEIKHVDGHIARIQQFLEEDKPSILEMICPEVLVRHLRKEALETKSYEVWRRETSQWHTDWADRVAEYRRRGFLPGAATITEEYQMAKDYMELTGRMLEIYDDELGNRPGSRARTHGKGGYEKDIRRNGLKASKLDPMTKGIGKKRAGVRKTTSFDVKNLRTNSKRMERLAEKAKDGQKFKHYFYRPRYVRSRLGTGVNIELRENTAHEASDHIEGAMAIESEQSGENEDEDDKNRNQAQDDLEDEGANENGSKEEDEIEAVQDEIGEDSEAA